MEVADADSAWVGTVARRSIAAERGTDVVDVLLDVVLPDDLTLYVVLPSLDAVARSVRRGVGGVGWRCGRTHGCCWAVPTPGPIST